MPIRSRVDNHQSLHAEYIHDCTFSGENNRVEGQFSLLDSSRKRILNLEEDQQEVGKKLRVIRAEEANDGLYIGSVDGETDLFSVFRKDSSGGAKLVLSNPEGGTNKAEIDLDIATADLTGLTVNASNLTLTNDLTAGNSTVSTSTAAHWKVTGKTSSYLDKDGGVNSSGYVLGDACTRAVESSYSVGGWVDSNKLVTADQVVENTQQKTYFEQTITESNKESTTKYASLKAITDWVAENTGSGGFGVTDADPGIFPDSGTNAIPDDAPTSEDVGNIAKNTTCSALRSKSLSELLSDIFFKDDNPTVNQPPIAWNLPANTNVLLGDNLPNVTVKTRSGRYYSVWGNDNATRYHAYYGDPIEWSVSATNHTTPDGNDDVITDTTVDETTDTSSWTESGNPNYQFQRTTDWAVATSNIGIVRLNFSATLDSNPTPDATTAYGNAITGPESTITKSDGGTHNVYVVAPVYWGYRYRTGTTGAPGDMVDEGNTGTTYNWQEDDEKYEIGTLPSTNYGGVGAQQNNEAFYNALTGSPKLFQCFAFPKESILPYHTSSATGAESFVTGGACECTVDHGMLAVMLAVDPLPTVPATWMVRRPSWGFPNFLSSFRIRSSLKVSSVYFTERTRSRSVCSSR